jgi:hypothetical protein
VTAPTAREIEAAALASLAAFPTVARLVAAGDPRVLAQIRAQAAMLAMLAEQVENARFEPFVKSRDSTVLADATLKGILPLARSCRVSLTVKNNDAAPFTVTANRRLLDPKGRIFMVDSDVIIAPGQTATVAATQRTTRSIAHTVTAPAPFYRMEVSTGEGDTYITGLQVFKGSDEFTYVPDWFNVEPSDLIYQVETDERRRLLVCMGATDVVGYGVLAGDEFEMRVTECEGKIEDLQTGAAFGLEYVLTVADGKQELTLDAVTDTGAAPPTISDLRVMARYPSIYDHNAVYLGEFDMMLRRYITGIRFLSVWNEQIEESFRGPDEDNINTLFVSGVVDGMSDPVFQARARELIARADDSYGVVFVPAVVKAIPVTITGQIAVVHDKATVEAQIRGVILANYASGSPLVSSGMSNPLRVQAIAKLLKENVPAFQDAVSDFSVSVTLGGTPNPEDFVQITNASLTVTLVNANHNGGLWNH